MLVKVNIEGIYYDAESKAPVVMLKEANGEMRVPIWIGPFEAMAILIATDEVAQPRPITHDVAANMLRALGGRVARVEVTKIVDGVYHSLLEVEGADGTVTEIDSRPSDAVALAARFAAPIYVARAVFDEVKRKAAGETKDQEYWRKYLEGLDAQAFGKFKM